MSTFVTVTELEPGPALVQVVPPSIDHSTSVTALPPLEPCTKSITAEESLGATTKPVGADGTVRGVTVRALDAGPWPADVTARRVTEYAVPLLRLEIVNGFAGEPPPVTVVQLVPPLMEYWYDVIGIPPVLTLSLIHI